MIRKSNRLDMRAGSKYLSPTTIVIRSIDSEGRKTRSQFNSLERNTNRETRIRTPVRAVRLPLVEIDIPKRKIKKRKLKIEPSDLVTQFLTTNNRTGSDVLETWSKPSTTHNICIKTINSIVDKFSSRLDKQESSFNTKFQKQESSFNTKFQKQEVEIKELRNMIIKINKKIVSRK
jgi:hypothetical protein